MVDYEKREKLNVTKDIIFNKHIKVYSREACTSWIDIEQIKLVHDFIILDNIKYLKRLAKENNIKLVGINKLRQKVISLFPIYFKEAHQYMNLFKELSRDWENHDMRQGWSDDKFYQEVLKPKYFKLQNMKKYKTPIKEYTQIHNRIVECIKEINNGKEYISITF